MTSRSKPDKSAVLILLIPTVLVMVLLVGGVIVAITNGEGRVVAVMLAFTLVCVGALLMGFRQARRSRLDAGDRGE